MRPATVRFQTQDGTWEVGGVDRKRGIVPENIKYAADEHGPTRASFDLKRDPGAIWPDLKAFTPLELEVDGVVVWSGRIKETPMTESPDGSGINVQAEGWQYHLDDDLYAKSYVLNKLTDWRDLRSFPTTTINRVGMAAGQVTTDGGAIAFGWPKGAQVAGGTSPMVGVTLDLGPNSTAKRIVIDWTKVGATATAGLMTLLIRGHDTEDGVNPASSENALNSDVATLAAFGTTTFTFATAHRYVSIMLFYFNAANATFGEDNIFRVTAAQVFTAAAYESGNASILKASTPIRDAFDNAPLLSKDRSKITTTSFSIPEFAVPEPKTPREIIEAVNAYHDYQYAVGADKVPVLRARPAVATIQIGSESAAKIEDASANSSDEIYNKAVITGTGPNGSPIYEERHTAVGDTADTGRPSSVNLANPSMDVDTGGWAISGGGTPTLARDTGVFDTSPASLRITNGSLNFADLVVTNNTYAGSGLEVGRVYEVRIQYRKAAGYMTFLIVDPNTGKVMGRFEGITTIGSFVTTTARFAATSANMQLQVNVGGAGTSAVVGYIDSVKFYEATTTIPDARGFRRTKHLPVSFGVTSVSAQQLADVFLQGHKKTPFKGSVEIQGSRAVREVVSGEPVPPHLLTLYTGELLRLAHRIDPDTGGLGRDGRIAEVEVDLDADSATIALDSTRHNFEAFLERLAVVTGSRVQ